MMIFFTRVIILSIMLCSVSLVHADPKAGLWKVETQFVNRSSTSKFNLCIQQNRGWYLITSGRSAKNMGKKGTWSSDGASSLLLGINPAGSRADMYILESESAEKMTGAWFYYFSRYSGQKFGDKVYGTKYPANSLAVVTLTFQGRKCPALTY